MQEKIKDSLEAKGFNKISNNIDLIKVTNDDKQDLRCFFDNERLGLHISGVNPNLDVEEILEDKEIGQYLEVLYISSSLLQEITIDSTNFPMLKYINLNQNDALKTITLNNLSSLEELYTHHCPALEKLYLEGEFLSLAKLDTSFCILKELNLPTSLPKLGYFNFTKNHLDSTEFLSFVADKDSQLNMEYLFWKGNPLPESFINTLEINEISVLKAFFIGNQVSIYRKKLILLGNTQAGKTSLCDILLDTNHANGNSTHGVNICTYEPEKNKIIQIYDFGGQDFYHNTHLSFFSTNANYLLVYGNGQKDEYYQIDAQDVIRKDDVFPMQYWLNSIAANVGLAEQTDSVAIAQNEEKDLLEELDKEEDSLIPKNPNPDEHSSESFNKLKDSQTIEKQFDDKNIKLGLLENLLENKKAKRLNEKTLEEEFGATEFWHYQLRKTPKSPLGDDEANLIKATFDNWLLQNIRQDQLRQDIKNWGENIQKKNPENAIVEKATIVNDEGKMLSEAEFKLLHASYYIFLCEPQKKETIPPVLTQKVIVNLGLFAQWIYAILNLENLLGKGYFNAEKAETWLKKTKFNPAIPHLDFIIAYLLYQKMIFQIESSNEFLVPQYLPEPQYPADKLLLNLFKKPFVRYEFTGFYHTQLLTNIIAKFFEKVAKEKVDGQYRYLIWKNKVILYLVKQDDIVDKNPANFLLITFDIIDQQPTLSLSVLDNKDLNERYDTIKTVVKFIDETLEKDAIKHKKLLKAPNNHYIDAKLLGENNTDSKGNISDLIFDVHAKCFYRKGDFPLFVDPKIFPMKKIFISYSKFDEPYKNEFKSHLISLQRENLIDTFDDRELELGEKWDSKLRQKIQECDFFVCLVSVKFLNVGYIENIELPEAFRNNKRLILIIIKPCDWQNFTITWIDENGNRTTQKLGDYNAFDKGNAIGLQENYVDSTKIIKPNTEIERDYQWLRVIQAIRDLLKK
ncbi:MULTISPECIES: TIR domain-containing protein [unclassified Arcicella]|uniref:TIR domain-containing protein n=1 Tax=unclassified Arcicella TaxID=2644986 RepID=UPI0028661722|nr:MULTISPECIES: TIR domain-containing protein [unclassified Arcicella]MDR6565015.1 GTPase SAR1 family protein [Arcicella sp. BE51]MDR6814828.1 GTPase SAR1 family protein [Arcicella sp. BE140]MDR6826284.1 GTPase SAR1 family protein [Arcicella sp. BE139]